MKNCSVRVIGCSLLLTVFVGVVVTSAVIFFSEPAATRGTTLASASDFLGLIMLAAIVSMPMSVLMGFLGGILATWIFKRKKIDHWGFTASIRLGSLWGALLGFIGSVLWFGGMNLGASGLLLLLLATAPVGLLTGAIVGSIVGAYCHRLSLRNNF